MRSPPPEDAPNSAQPEWLANWTELFIGNLEEYAVFAIDLSGTILTWQPGVRQVLGYERDAFVGQHTDAIFTASDRRAGAPAGELKTAVQTGQATDERWHVRADGSRFWGSGVVIALSDGHGQTVGLAKIVRDRTALRLEGELQGLRALRLEGDVAFRTRQVQALAADLTLAEQRRAPAGKVR
jgi:PAS domain S-box-containing protein